MRIGVASIVQETNTFAAQPSTLVSFRTQGLWVGDEAAARMAGSNTEFWGSLDQVRQSGHDAVPLVRAWAMSGGILTAAALSELERTLARAMEEAGHLDGLVLSLHGALAADGTPDADGHLIEVARALLPAPAPIVVTFDLHANVTQRAVAAADALIGYHTYPHVDQADTGRRAARLLLRCLAAGGRGTVASVMAKRAMLIPAEAQATTAEPMKRIRERATALTRGAIADVSLFPVQPWLDVPELGFATTVTSFGDIGEAGEIAEAIADAAWSARREFRVDIVPVQQALAHARGRGHRSAPVLLLHSADSPTAGAAADSAALLRALVNDTTGLRWLSTLVDAAAVERCFQAGAGTPIRAALGGTPDPTWRCLVEITGSVERCSDAPLVLSGPAMHGQLVSMGRWATVRLGPGRAVLVTERPAPTFDPAAYRHAGLEPRDVDAVEVRSAGLYRAGWGGEYADALLLDLPGPSTPQLRHLTFTAAPRPMYPLDE